MVASSIATLARLRQSGSSAFNPATVDEGWTVITSPPTMNAPIEQSTLRDMIRDHLGEAEVEVTGEGNRFDVMVASAAFRGLSRVRQQQLVYEAIGDLIRDGTVHAVTIRTVASGDP